MTVTGRFSGTIIPSVHKIRQIISIYIYCSDIAANKQWSSNFCKVKDIVIKVNELISRIQKKVEEPLSIDIFSTNGRTATGVNG